MDGTVLSLYTTRCLLNLHLNIFVFYVVEIKQMTTLKCLRVVRRFIQVLRTLGGENGARNTVHTARFFIERFPNWDDKQVYKLLTK